MKLQNLIPTPPRDGSYVTDRSRLPFPARMQRILVTDDEEDIRHLISSVLAGDGFDVTTASDGEKAWEALLHERYDLLVTDNEMPGLMGINLIERIRKAGMKLPVIVASAFLSVEGVRDYAELQITAVIPKPFDISEFLNIVRIALRVSGEDAATDHGIFAGDPLPLSTPQPQAAKPGHNHVLIADDDSLVRGSLASVLESEGYVVDEARDGIEAVTRAVEHTPDLVLLDLNMPHADGWTAFSLLDRVTPLLPVIVITARSNQYQEAVRLGVDAFMEKPLNIPILVKAVKRLTSEEQDRYVRRITNPAFVTRLLDNKYS
jgi:DNA-binding response OmpR family regulator